MATHRIREGMTLEEAQTYWEEYVGTDKQYVVLTPDGKYTVSSGVTEEGVNQYVTDSGGYRPSEEQINRYFQNRRWDRLADENNLKEGLSREEAAAYWRENSNRAGSNVTIVQTTDGKYTAGTGYEEADIQAMLDATGGTRLSTNQIYDALELRPDGEQQWEEGLTIDEATDLYQEYTDAGRDNIRVVRTPDGNYTVGVGFSQRQTDNYVEEAGGYQPTQAQVDRSRTRNPPVGTSLWDQWDDISQPPELSGTSPELDALGLQWDDISQSPELSGTSEELEALRAQWENISQVPDLSEALDIEIPQALQDLYAQQQTDQTRSMDRSLSRAGQLSSGAGIRLRNEEMDRLRTRQRAEGYGYGRDEAIRQNERTWQGYQAGLGNYWNRVNQATGTLDRQNVLDRQGYQAGVDRYGDRWNRATGTLDRENAIRWGNYQAGVNRYKDRWGQAAGLRDYYSGGYGNQVGREDDAIDTTTGIYG